MVDKFLQSNKPNGRLGEARQSGNSAVGEKGSIVAGGATVTEVPTVFVEQVVDTTAAGDSFNAGYLAARLRGASPIDAAKNGSLLASTVVQHRGAIIPREAMQAVLY